MKTTRTAVALALAVIGAPTLGLAQDLSTDTAVSAEPLSIDTLSTQNSRQRGFVFSLRGGAGMKPKYLGSDDYEVTPDLGFRLHRFTLSEGLDYGSGDAWNDFRGWDFHGSFDYIGRRDSSDDDALRGMDDIDPAYELGFGFGYTDENYNVYSDFRRGFGGHEGWTAEAGLDLIARPTREWRLSMGPRLYWGSDEFADTYFGVSSSEATADRPAYDPDGGLLGGGAEFVARYQLNDDWGLEGGVTWRKFMNDALDSPIVDSGAEDQWTIRFGVIRVVRMNF
ncbi:MAG: MipA/OmpV family protein [Salipiger thiooxidans]|uniref:MipA/OmpV family protein n=1 Tax=Salipiger thiooxidans TaxID=282683 RepID=UPI001CFB259F|nr:MipA/OmpV family protein [Salipiger thiooxidans]